MGYSTIFQHMYKSDQGSNQAVIIWVSLSFVLGACPLFSSSSLYVILCIIVDIITLPVLLNTRTFCLSVHQTVLCSLLSSHALCTLPSSSQPLVNVLNSGQSFFFLKICLFEMWCYVEKKKASLSCPFPKWQQCLELSQAEFRSWSSVKVS